MTGKSTLLMSDKMSFHGLERGMACWYTCIYFFSFFLHGCKNVTDVIMHSQIHTVNFVYHMHGKSSTRTAAAIRLHVKMRRKGAECKEGKQWWHKTEEQFRCVRLVCMCRVFFLIISRKPVKWRRKLKRLSKWKIATMPCYSYYNHFNPPPIRIPRCVDTVKCITLYD